MTRARPQSISSGSGSAPGAVVEKVTGRVDVRAGVRAQVQRRHVRAVAAGQALDRFELKRRVAGVGRDVRIERDRDVDELHGRDGVAIIAHWIRRRFRAEVLMARTV